MLLASAIWHLKTLSPVLEHSDTGLFRLLHSFSFRYRTVSGIWILFLYGTGLTVCRKIRHSALQKLYERGKADTLHVHTAGGGETPCRYIIIMVDRNTSCTYIYSSWWCYTLWFWQIRSKCRNAKKSYFGIGILATSQRRQSGIAGHGLVRHLPCYAYTHVRIHTVNTLQHFHSFVNTKLYHVPSKKGLAKLSVCKKNISKFQM